MWMSVMMFAAFLMPTIICMIILHENKETPL